MDMMNKIKIKFDYKMKSFNKMSFLVSLIAVFSLSVFNSCKDESDLELPYIFRPINFQVEVNKTEATFSWAAVDSAVSYTLQVGNDSTDFSTLVLDTTITDLTYVQEFAGKTKFFARVRANASDTTKNSKFNVVSFTTKAENLFTDYTSDMSDWQTIDLKWTPGSKVTHIVLSTIVNADTTEISTISIPQDSVATGHLVVSDMANAKYFVSLYNGNILRGTVKVTVEGTTYVSEAGDIKSTISAASDGDVIVLAPGKVFTIGTATVLLNKNIKIKGGSNTKYSVICMSSGASSGSAMFGFEASSSFSYIKFENVDFSGYTENNTSGTMVAYLINNGTTASVGQLSFYNCNLHDFGNTSMRLKDGKGQQVDSLIYNNCKIYNIGFAGTYSVVNVNKATDVINNISFKNSTIYNFKNSFILYQLAPFTTISVVNCNIYKGMQDASSTRFLVDCSGSTSTAATITLSNSILGLCGTTYGAGVRTGSTNNVLTVTSSYYTSDYNDQTLVGGVSYSIVNLLKSYSGTSANLWTDPANGDFTLKDSSFAGNGVVGDLRWY
jgi:hypothetical protein